MNPDFTGGCLCGAVRYHAMQMMRAGLCHCRMCQKASGAPVVAWLVVPITHFAITAGKPVAYRSSPKAFRRFCGACGTQLTFSVAKNPREVDINLATLDHPETVEPQYHIYTSSRLPWLDIHDALPRFAEGRPTERAPTD